MGTYFFLKIRDKPEMEVFPPNHFKGSVGEDGTLIKVVLDRSGVYLGKFDFFVKSQRFFQIRR